MLALMDKKNPSPKKESLKCKYCDKEYKTQRGFDKHECEKKLRFEVRGTKAAAIGLHAFNNFYRTQMGGTKLKSYADFESSPYYRAFLKFGNYCVETKVLEPEQFAEYLLSKRVRVDLWCKDKQYDDFLIYLLQHEPVAKALERAILYSHEWAKNAGAEPRDLFRYAVDQRLVGAIVSGKISPWVIYNCNSGKKFLDELPGAYMDSVWEYIDANIWEKIFDNHPEDVAFAKTVLITAGW